MGAAAASSRLLLQPRLRTVWRAWRASWASMASALGHATAMAAAAAVVVAETVVLALAMRNWSQPGTPLHLA
jgi:ADP-ribosylglycohydrolase